MFALFQSIFTLTAPTAAPVDPPYSEALIEAAIERAIEGTDARLRAVPNYRKRLRDPILHAIDHVVQMVDNLPSHTTANADGYRNNALLSAMFASTQRMFDVLARDRELKQERAKPGGNSYPLYGLLMTHKSVSTRLGIDEINGQTRKDVEQRVVSFDDHRLVDLNRSEKESDRALKRRAFDHILSQVLSAFDERRGKRQKLAGQRQLLRRKYEIMRGSGWSFDSAQIDSADPTELERKIQDVDNELAKLGAETETLSIHLNMLAEMLANAEKFLRLETATVILDHLNVERRETSSVAREIIYQEIHDGRGEQWVIAKLIVEPALLPKVDIFQNPPPYM